MPLGFPAHLGAFAFSGGVWKRTVLSPSWSVDLANGFRPILERLNFRGGRGQVFLGPILWVWFVGGVNSWVLETARINGCQE